MACAAGQTASWLLRLSHEFDDDGRFELVLSAERPEGVKNWVQLDNIARTLVTRQYFTDLRQKRAELNIELLDDITPPPAPTVEGITHRLRALSQSLSRTFKSTQLASEAWMKHPNTVSVDSRGGARQSVPHA